MRLYDSVWDKAKARFHIGLFAVAIVIALEYKCDDKSLYNFMLLLPLISISTIYITLGVRAFYFHIMLKHERRGE